MQKKRLFISVAAVLLALILVSVSIFAIKAYYKPTPGIFLELPDKAILYYTNEAGEKLEKEPSQDEILLLHTQFQELITHFIGCNPSGDSMRPFNKNSFDKEAYDERKYNGTIEYYYNKRVEYKKVFNEFDKEAEEWGKWINYSYSFYGVCDMVIIELKGKFHFNYTSQSGYGIRFSGACGKEYFKTSGTPVFTANEYLAFEELFRSMC